MKVISSSNGREATRRVYELLAQGADALDAVVAGVTLVEDDPDETSVGYGGLPNEQGEVELDAAVMHGPTHRVGGVAGLRRVRHAAQVAREVLRRTDHVLIVGEGALSFARACGFPEENLLTEKARRIWLYWKQTLSDKHDWLPPVGPIDPHVAEFFNLSLRPSNIEANVQPGAPQKTRSRLPRPTGTIHCSALTDAGDIAGVTTTSGLAFKIPGRVGDSPIVGAGLYVDNEIGSCGSTGRGEATLKNLSSFAAVELMRQSLSPLEAGLEVLRRVVKHTTEPWLLDAAGLPNFHLKLYLLSKAGSHAGVSLRGPGQFAITDERGTRLEECVPLLDGGDR
ncbi:MAG: asparaginase [Planctomycetaceae bacterium]|nr:asparaginase [Planctomycetaceae bacterium]